MYLGTEFNCVSTMIYSISRAEFHCTGQRAKYPTPTEKSLVRGEASGFLGHLEELFASLEAGLCNWVTCWIPTGISGSPVLCRETWMSQLPPVLC